MEKNIFNDMKPKKSRISTITRQDVVGDSKSAAGRKPSVSTLDSKPIKESAKQEMFQEKRLRGSPMMRPKRPALRKHLLITFVACIVLGAFYFAINTFENAKVTLIAKHSVVSLKNEQFMALKGEKDPIHFEIMIVSDRQLKDMVLTESENVSTKAQGSIVLYNEFSSKSQTIASGTFVADSKGKTYKLDTAVTIPGYTLDPKIKTKIIAGQASVGITAFLPGESYNGTEVNFSIPSYKGTSKFTKIYAKAKTPLTGGAQGLVYKLSPTEKGALDSQANSFKTKLIEKVKAQVPPGYVLFPHASNFSYLIDSEIASPQPQAKVGIEGTLSAVIFKEDELRSAVILRHMPDIKENELREIKVPNLLNIEFAFTNKELTISKDMQSVGFTFTGDATFDWHPDIETLRTNLVGVPKSEIPAILATDPGIASGTVKIFPPWKSSMPYGLSKITITAE